ncbi:DUF1993 family protein [Aestuariivirga litoralis]|uniref:DUF1993 family protein n=1 Tax=Aestuariivirga litoralis TaxID=2650924 RepID=UPI0018C52314|nr:DUF1993 family protein [Aestuariivirga litoralis]
MEIGATMSWRLLEEDPMTAPSDGSSVHLLTIGALQSGLQNMAVLLDKAQAQPGTSAPALLEARLHPDMFNLLQQLQYMAFLSVDLARHLTKVPPPRVGYDETTWQEARQSLAAAAAYLGSIPVQDVAKRADQVVPTFMDDSKGMSLLDYAAKVIVPDFYFHMVIAYGILRHRDISIGKSDYLGALQTVNLTKP